MSQERRAGQSAVQGGFFIGATSGIVLAVTGAAPIMVALLVAAIVGFVAAVVIYRRVERRAQPPWGDGVQER